MYTVPFFNRGDTEAPQRPQRPQRRKHDAFFQRGHRGAAFFLLMLTLSNSYHDLVLENNFAILNSPSSYTRIASSHNQRSSVIDLCFANSTMLPFVQSWTNNLPSSGSDHTVIQIKINPPFLPTVNS